MERLKILGDCATEVIRERQYPMPNLIKFVAPKKGYKSQLGVCKKRTNSKTKETTYEIRVSIIKPKFILCEEDKHKHKTYRLKGQSGVYRIGDVGEVISFRDIINTMAHETAHLKYWRHTYLHKHTTDVIEKELISKLKARGVDIEAPLED
jgi:hypothetical protein